jgi:hypothetical protein
MLNCQGLGRDHHGTIPAAAGGTEGDHETSLIVLQVLKSYKPTDGSIPVIQILIHEHERSIDILKTVYLRLSGTG